MKVPLAWLAEYVPLVLPPTELAHRLTMAGVEATYDPGNGHNWEEILIGQVVNLAPHPNADRLQLATVNLNGEEITVVCGAPNIAKDQKVAVAKVGAVLLDGHSKEADKKIELVETTIRGIVSSGMLCSERELGLSDDQSGILILPNDAPIGRPLGEYLRTDVLDLDVTTNRVDCLSMLGVAREVAAITGNTITEPPISYEETGPKINQSVAITIENPLLCKRYLATVIRGVEIKPSPPWMQTFLAQAGLRPINNVVDVTNFVMMEYGQPLHAFDMHMIHKGAIVIRTAKPEEPFTTLDGEQHKLNSPMLLIADSNQGIALAGVMGGANSEMTNSTVDVLLESATFDALNTRRTAQLLKLRTEASARFEKGLNPELAMRALRRATSLILKTAGGQADQGLAEAFPNPQRPEPVRLRSARLKHLMGVSFSRKQISTVLKSLGFEVTIQKDGVSAIPPYWRTDVTIEEDLIEEVARIIGYDSVPGSPLSGGIPQYTPQPLRELREHVKDLLVSAGMQEVVSYSLVSHALLVDSGAIKDDQQPPIRIANPMSREQEFLRTTLRGGLLRAMAAGLRRTYGNMRLFEAGRIYLQRSNDLPEEREMVFGALAGTRDETLWAKESTSLDFYDAKGLIESLLASLGLNPVFKRTTDSIFHPGQAAIFTVDGQQVGSVGVLHPRVIETFDLALPTVACFELDLSNVLANLPGKTYKYQPFSRFPTAERDIALVVDKTLPAEQIHLILERDPLVRKAVLFDLFSGTPLPEGKKSLAYRLELQSDTGTLSTEKLNEVMAALVKQLEDEAGASLRT